ncbi:hypothetical protein EH165_07890 [Nakamurella antarctica]|uniref:Uncharacterized protein n=1 Tax=Nakamurella antarctica TaxID=1902245 RepID=A0A3G8ZL72_9ACTN|nr:hypothetical protein [Nakamurella antarctica]AZI58072.1 hypothetical protein EH165_07890 [Nakamurella antarctica]
MTEPGSAYFSSLSISFDAPGEGRLDAAPEWLTAADTDRSDVGLASIRTRIVDPVVSSLLSPQELQGLLVYRDGREVWVHLESRDDSVSIFLHSADLQPEYAEAAAMAQHLASQLEDWVCETSFGWGQQRIARYTLPEQPGGQ